LALQLRMTLGLHRGHDGLSMCAGPPCSVASPSAGHSRSLARLPTLWVAMHPRGFSQPTLPLAGPGSHLDSYSADAMSQPEWSSRYDSPARSTSMVQPQPATARLARVPGGLIAQHA